MSTPEEFVASLLLYNGGYRLDPERMADHMAAVRDRARVDGQELVRRVETLALDSVRAHRAATLEHWDWRRAPTPERLAAVRAAQQLAGEARDALFEACGNDEDLFADVCRRYGVTDARRSAGDVSGAAAWVSAHPLPQSRESRLALRRAANIRTEEESRSGGTYR